MTVPAPPLDPQLEVRPLCATGLRERYGADLVLVRPDQHVAWRGDRVTGRGDRSEGSS